MVTRATESCVLRRVHHLNIMLEHIGTSYRPVSYQLFDPQRFPNHYNVVIFTTSDATVAAHGDKQPPGRVTSFANGAPHWSSSSIPTVDAQRPGPQAEVMAPWPRAANVVAVAVASPCGERHGVPRGLKTAENGHGGASRRFRRDSRPLRKSQGVGPVSRGFLGPFVGSVRPWPAKKNGRAGPYRLERGCARGAFKFVVKITTV